MKVNINNKIYVIQFKYRDDKNTYCFIREKGSKRVELVGHARRRTSSWGGYDPYNKTEAMKYSLRSALNSCFMDDEPVEREIRAGFWHAFNNRKNSDAVEV